MIRSYLGYVEMSEMISRRLTKTQKAEILEAYRAGDNTNVLAEKYSCSTNTINRTVKNLLSDTEFILLKEERSKLKNKKGKAVNNQTLKDQKEDIKQSNSLISLDLIDKVEDMSIKENEDLDVHEDEKSASVSIGDDNKFDEVLSSENQRETLNDVDKNNQEVENNFEVIAPLVSGFDFNQENQRTDFEILSYESLPESVYMIVDKKVELDLQPISDLPEWSFLPEKELKRNAILLFLNQRSAKRNCSRTQRVIKVPNTSIFKISKPYLISKGITRLILEDSIIALDN